MYATNGNVFDPHVPPLSMISLPPPQDREEDPFDPRLLAPKQVHFAPQPGYDEKRLKELAKPRHVSENKPPLIAERKVVRSTKLGATKKSAESKDIQILKKQLSEQSNQLSIMQSALSKRDEQINKLTDLVERLVTNSEKVKCCEEPIAKNREETSVQEPNKKCESGTSIGLSLFQIDDPETSVQIAPKIAPISTKRKTVAAQIKAYSPPPTNERVSETPMPEQAFFQQMLSLAQKWGTNQEAKQPEPTTSNNKSLHPEWSVLLNEANGNHSLSGELNALAMKYLDDSHLVAVGGDRRYCESKDNGPPQANMQIRARERVTWQREMHSIVEACDPAFSIATNDFMGRHGIQNKTNRRTYAMNYDARGYDYSPKRDERRMERIEWDSPTHHNRYTPMNRGAPPITHHPQERVRIPPTNYNSEAQEESLNLADFDELENEIRNESQCHDCYDYPQ